MFGWGKKQSVFDSIYGKSARRERVVSQGTPPVTAVSSLANYRYKFEDGDKFFGGFGTTELLINDYWTLRARSSELFERNLYARGLIRRLITNELNTGLHLESTPEESILGFPEDGLADWSENVENRFFLWAKDPFLCDVSERRTFGAIQAEARMEALIAGDVLVTLRQQPTTGLPRVQLVSGSAVQTPWGSTPQRGNRISHGVEIDAMGRHVAFWIRQPDGTGKRLPAYGEKSGRRLAWLIYGTDKRLEDVRGKPILSLVLQSLKEIDRYRDSTQRKAVLLAMLAMFISKGEAAPGTRPITGGAVRRGVVESTSGSARCDRSFKVAEHIPGLVIDELQVGEKPEAFQTNGTVESFGVFEEAIVQSVAWANEIPPEILKLSFSSNYSASQAAINEFKQYLNKVRNCFGESFCSPIYQEWLLAESITQSIEAPGLLEAWRDPARAYEFGAWATSDWSGNIKPAVDPSKLVKGYSGLVGEGFMTRDRAARELTGMKFSKVVQRLKRENEQLAEALAPMQALLRPALPEQASDDPSQDEEDSADDKAKASARIQLAS